MAITCCYKCEKRFPGCHDTCSIYIKEKKEYQESKKRYNLSNGYPIRPIRNGDFLGDEGQLKYFKYNDNKYRRKKGKK